MAQRNVKQQMQGEKRSSNRDWTKTYDESDLKHVLQVSHAHNWNDAIKYLDEKGMNDNELTPGETISMKTDLQNAVKGRSAFTDDPTKAFKAIRGAQARGGGARRPVQKKR